MEQLDLFSSIDNRVDLNSDSAVKIVKVEIKKKYDVKAILTYRESGSEENIKKNISEYFERVKNILGITEYKFLSFEIAN